MLTSIINIHQGIQKLWTGHDLHRQTDRRTDGQTDGRTDRQSDSYIPPEFRSWGVMVPQV